MGVRPPHLSLLECFPSSSLAENLLDPVGEGIVSKVGNPEDPLGSSEGMKGRDLKLRLVNSENFG